MGNERDNCLVTSNHKFLLLERERDYFGTERDYKMSEKLKGTMLDLMDLKVTESRQSRYNEIMRPKWIGKGFYG